MLIFLFFSLDQKKNKPKEPPKVPKSAPFFIPTVPGLVPRYAAPEQNNDPQQVKTKLEHSKYMGGTGRGCVLYYTVVVLFFFTNTQFYAYRVN